jgi:hypothetical protein
MCSSISYTVLQHKQTTTEVLFVTQRSQNQRINHPSDHYTHSSLSATKLIIFDTNYTTTAAMIARGASLAAAGKVTVGKSAAARLIQHRATTCSISSVFYLKQGGMKEAAQVERLFVVTIGVPVAMLGMGGLYKMMHDC